jgi:hypothetical protein
LSLFQNAVVEERFQDAAFIRDNACAGLVSLHKIRIIVYVSAVIVFCFWVQVQKVD